MKLTESSSHATGSPLHFCVISTCMGAWGGSEELWAGAATSFLNAGHSVTALKPNVDYKHPRIKQLKSLNGQVQDLFRVNLAVLTRLFNFVVPEKHHISLKQKHLLYTAFHLKTRRPNLVIISQADNYDGLHFTKLCRKLNIPYVLISQKTTDFHWPQDRWRASMQEAFKSAVKCYFVSHHNRNLTEEQINLRLPNAKVVWNPFMVPDEGAISWPASENEQFNLACVGRLYLKDKGQDVLIQVLAKEKWKNRNLHVTFFGDGENREGLTWLAAEYGVKNVVFAGNVSDVAGIWRSHHALIMPSRSEGLPLVLVEAMMCGRTAIMTDVGGSAEVIEDNVTGFLCDPTVKDMDAALERAWQQRHDWQKMGELAGIKIREIVPSNPAEVFADEIISVANSLPTSKN